MGRIPSTIEIPNERRPFDREHRTTPDFDLSDDYCHCRRSPSYDSYNRSRDRRCDRHRPESSERRSPKRVTTNEGHPNGDALPKNFGRQNGGLFHNRDRRNGDWRRRFDSESDEELKGLPFKEYRRLKRQKMRNSLRHCIWNITPSPPRRENEQESEEEKAEEINEMKNMESDTEEEERKNRKGKRKSGKRRGSRKKRNYSESDESEESESNYSSDGSSRRKKKHSSLSKVSRREKSKKSESESEGSESEEEKDSADAKNKATVEEVMKTEVNPEALKLKELFESQKTPALDNEPAVEPMPLPRAEGHISYGRALRPGEGDAIAYAEDKRALAMFNYEEKAKREHKVMADLQRLVQRHIGQDVGPTHDPFAAKTSDGADA
ncbi:hypothetical protein Ahy_B08g090776 [Arachis hypogaea]|uniref:NF-kappa-B-activating protein C-terminal domain-containing protein n=1 Tax=Arachis hypogaea TaxID=3818 RepID=A0A444Y0N3_ARAHY|nr:hypothetical protein Ahy_B08g090776 [Arachis hypogaea]